MHVLHELACELRSVSIRKANGVSGWANPVFDVVVIVAAVEMAP